MKKICKVRHKKKRINFSKTKDRALKSFWGCFNINLKRRIRTHTQLAYSRFRGSCYLLVRIC